MASTNNYLSMWVLLDNYDSFSYILHHYLLHTGNECIVIKNDELSLEEIKELKPSRIILSPGPKTPREAGISMEVLAHFHDKVPILGICLGHQAIGLFFGASLKHSPAPMHGKTSRVQHYGQPIFEGVEPVFEVMRYHSLCIELAQNEQLENIATSLDDKVLMAIAHKKLPLIGLQFHPESIGTKDGQQIIDNWAKLKY